MLVCLLSMMYLSSYPETTFLDLSSSSSPGCPSCTCHQGASSNRSSSSGRFQIGIFSTSPATERRQSGTGSFCWVRGRHICYCLTFGLLIYTNEWKVFNVGTSGKVMKNLRHKLQKGGNSPIYRLPRQVRKMSVVLSRHDLRPESNPIATAHFPPEHYPSFIHWHFALRALHIRLVGSLFDYQTN